MTTLANGGERVEIRDRTPNGKDATETFTGDPVHDTEEIDNGEQRIETRQVEKQRVPEDHQEDRSMDQDESDEEENEDEDEDEPSLKYQRITGAIPDLLKKDSASALAISNKMMVIPISLISKFASAHYFVGNGYSYRYHSHTRFNWQTDKVLQASYGFGC